MHAELDSKNTSFIVQNAISTKPNQRMSICTHDGESPHFHLRVVLVCVLSYPETEMNKGSQYFELCDDIDAGTGPGRPFAKIKKDWCPLKKTRPSSP